MTTLVKMFIYINVLIERNIYNYKGFAESYKDKLMKLSEDELGDEIEDILTNFWFIVKPLKEHLNKHE